MAPKRAEINQPPTEALRPDQSVPDEFLAGLPEELKEALHIGVNPDAERIFARDDMGKILPKAARNAIINEHFSLEMPGEEHLTAENGDLHQQINKLTSENQVLANENQSLRGEVENLGGIIEGLSEQIEGIRVLTESMQHNPGLTDEQMQERITEAEQRAQAEAEARHEHALAEAEARHQAELAAERTRIDDAIEAALAAAEAEHQQRMVELQAQLGNGQNEPGPGTYVAPPAPEIRTINALRDTYLSLVAGAQRRTWRPFGKYSKKNIAQAREEYEAAWNEQHLPTLGAIQNDAEREAIAQELRQEEDELLAHRLYQQRLVATGQYSFVDTAPGLLSDIEQKDRGFFGRTMNRFYNWYGRNNAGGRRGKLGAVIKNGIVSLGIGVASVGVGIGVAAASALAIPTGAALAAVAGGGVLIQKITRGYMAAFARKKSEEANDQFAARQRGELLAGLLAGNGASMIEMIETQKSREVKRNNIRTIGTVGAGALLGVMGAEAVGHFINIRALRADVHGLNLGMRNWIKDRLGLSFPNADDATPRGTMNAPRVTALYADAPTILPGQHLHSHGILHGFDRHADIGQGSGYIREIHDMFNQNGYHVNLHEAERLYNMSEGKFDGNYLRHIGSYWRGPDWGIDSPGHDMFRRNVARFLVEKAAEEDMIELHAA